MARLLGEKLRHLRRQSQITQVELAQKLGSTSQSHIAKVERDEDTASLSLVIRIAQLLNVSTDYLLRDTIPLEGPIQPLVTIPQDDQAPSFGTRLRALRLQHQMSQRDVAGRLGLASRAYIGGLELGRGKLPSMDLVVRIADLFGVTTDYLLRDTPPIEMRETDTAH